MKDVRFAKYVENHVAEKDIMAFVCESKDDMNLFTDLVREEQQLRVNVVCDPGTPLNRLQPIKPIQAYR